MEEYSNYLQDIKGEVSADYYLPVWTKYLTDKGFKGTNSLDKETKICYISTDDKLRVCGIAHRITRNINYSDKLRRVGNFHDFSLCYFQKFPYYKGDSRTYLTDYKGTYLQSLMELKQKEDDDVMIHVDICDIDYTITLSDFIALVYFSWTFCNIEEETCTISTQNHRLDFPIYKEKLNYFTEKYGMFFDIKSSRMQYSFTSRKIVGEKYVVNGDKRYKENKLSKLLKMNLGASPTVIKSLINAKVFYEINDNGKFVFIFKNFQMATLFQAMCSLSGYVNILCYDEEIKYYSVYIKKHDKLYSGIFYNEEFKKKDDKDVVAIIPNADDIKYLIISQKIGSNSYISFVPKPILNFRR